MVPISNLSNRNLHNQSNTLYYNERPSNVSPYCTLWTNYLGTPQQCKSTFPPVYPCSLYTPAGSSLRGESVDRRPNIVCSLIILQWDRSNRPPKANKLTTSLSRSTTLGSRRSRPLPTKITKNCKYQFPSLMRNKSKTGLSNTNPLNLKTASCSLSPPSSKEPKCAALMDFAMYKNIYIDQLLKLSFPSQRWDQR